MTDSRRVSYLLQPGIPVEDSAPVTAALRSRFPALHGPHPDGFCYAASDRAETVRVIASASDAMLVLGAADAPDSRRISALARDCGARTHVVSPVSDIVPAMLAGASVIGLAESTSASPALAGQVTEALSGLGPLSVTSRQVSTEVVGAPARRALDPRQPAYCGSGHPPTPARPTEAYMLFPTSLVGSYPQPDWLIDREKLAGRFPPRVRARELWRVDPAYLDQAQQDATLLAIRAQEDAGLDILTDGEIRRESYSNRFATALDGVDIDNPGTALDRSGHPNPVPRIVGPIRRRASGPGRRPEVPARAHRPDDQGHGARARSRWPSRPRTTTTQPGGGGVRLRRGGQRGDPRPVRGRGRHRPARRALPAGPAGRGKQYGVAVVNRALEGITGTTAVHLCFGYAAIIHERPVGLLVPARLGREHRRPGIDRDRAVQARLLGARPPWTARRSSWA